MNVKSENKMTQNGRTDLLTAMDVLVLRIPVYEFSREVALVAAGIAVLNRIAAVVRGFLLCNARRAASPDERLFDFVGSGQRSSKLERNCLFVGTYVL